MPPQSGARPGDKMDGYVRALAVFESWLVRRDKGEAESATQLLEANPELRDDLRDMLDAGVTAEALDFGATEDAPSHLGAALTMPEADKDFGDYRILECIGQGGMGAVYLAEHRELGRRVALKVIRPERLFSSVAKERFWREARAVAQLDHAHVCPVFEVGEVDGAPFMAMRYLEGQSLAQRIAEAQKGARLLDTSDSGPGAAKDSGTGAATGSGTGAATGSGTGTATGSMPSTRSEIHAVVALIEGIARGLHAAHETGIIHRDIKPGNIHVTPEGAGLLLDFGLARSVDGEGQASEPQLTMSGDLPGTPLYMSPEQIVPGGRGLDRTTDVYSLGVTLYECLTLRRLFDGASLHELQHEILNKPLVRPRRRNSHVPRDLEVVVEKALDRDPARRYRTAEEFAEDLRRVRSFEPIHARRPGAVIRAGRWVQRYPWAAAVMAIIVAALVVIALLLRDSQNARAEYDLLAWTERLRAATKVEAELFTNLRARIWETRSAERRFDPAPFEAWLRDHGEPIALHLPRFQSARATLQARAGGDPESPVFEREEDRFKHRMLGELIRDVEAFAVPETGKLARVRAHVAWCARARTESVDAHADAWREAQRRIANHGKYRGLTLEPQVGLVPLGPDRESTLEEFADLRSGAQAVRDAATGKLTITAETGMVFVLLPGGKFHMGAQKLDPKLPNFDPLARDHEIPVREVVLEPFFLSKYEMTQGQWKRLSGGEEPSGLKATLRDKGGRTMTLVHPVERVSWMKCDALLLRAALRLPTEAQWEYACRGGTTSPWFVGDDHRALEPHVNFADQSAQRSGFSEISLWPELNDGYAAHAPVDTKQPNPFGLHHVCGNVWEYCRDWYDLYSLDPRPGDGFRVTASGRSRVMRGSSYDRSFAQARSAYRSGLRPNAQGSSNGLRPVRALDH